MQKLSVSLHRKIKNTFTDMPEVCKMLRQLVLLMKYLDKERQDDPSQTIKQFLENIKIEAIRGMSISSFANKKSSVFTLI